tara:strand:- start:499 stop:867 length:369 start_codon:yes stop_codon:yes gene_type:complete
MKCIYLILLLLVSQTLHAKPTFEQYLADLKLQAIEQGYAANFVDKVFSGVSYRKKTVTADKNQPETKLTLDKYLATRVPDWKVKQGRIYLVYENFHTLMKWNRSSYFGVSVSYLSDRIKKGS